MAAYSIAYGREAEHAAELRAGLGQMVDGFSAYLCEMCQGEGQRREMFNAGCGGGYFRSMTGCDYCGATGLCQGDSSLYNPAPASVREQVLTAARRVAEGANNG